MSNVEKSRFRPLQVDMNKGDDIEFALKKLKRMVKDSKLMVEYQKHTEFKRPGQEKREKRLRARGRQRRESKNNY